MLNNAYVAGLFDGEGTVSLIYTKVRPWVSNPTKRVMGFKFTIALSNTYRPILEVLQRQFHGDISCSKLPRNKNHKTVWSWKIGGRDKQIIFLNIIAPFCIIKKEQIKLGLAYLETSKGAGQHLTQKEWKKRIAIFEKLRVRNQRGLVKKYKYNIPNEPNKGWNPAHRN